MNGHKHGAMALAASAVMILAAGCGSVSESDGIASVRSSDAAEPAPGGASNSTQTVLDNYIQQMTKVAECYRKNGLPDVPDPDQFGQVLIDTRNLTSQSGLHQARTACASLQVPMPPEVRSLISSDEAANLTDQQREINKTYAECMQAHGAPDFPDPLPNGLNDESKAWNQGSSGAQRALGECASVIGDPVTHGAGVG